MTAKSKACCPTANVGPKGEMNMTDEIENRLPAAIENTGHFDHELKSSNIQAERGG